MNEMRKLIRLIEATYVEDSLSEAFSAGIGVGLDTSLPDMEHEEVQKAFDDWMKYERENTYSDDEDNLWDAFLAGIGIGLDTSLPDIEHGEVEWAFDNWMKHDRENT